MYTAEQFCPYPYRESKRTGKIMCCGRPAIERSTVAAMPERNHMNEAIVPVKLQLPT